MSAGSNGGGPAGLAVAPAGPNSGNAAGTPTTDAPASTQGGSAPLGGVAPPSSGAMVTPASASNPSPAPAVAERIANANAIASGVKHLAAQNHAPTYPMNGYVATAGSTRPTALSQPSAASGGGTIGGTGISSVQATSAATGPLTGTVRFDGGYYTIAGGNDDGSDLKGRIQVIFSPNIIIGSSDTLSVSGGGAQITGATWSAQGTPDMYGSQIPFFPPQIVPNPSAGQTEFTNIYFDIGSIHGPTTGQFFWGEDPGNKTIKVHVDLSSNGKPGAADATFRVHVFAPGIAGKVSWPKNSRIVGIGGVPYLRFSHANLPMGITVNSLYPFPVVLDGQFAVVQQLIQSNISGSAVVNGVNTPYTGLWHDNGNEDFTKGATPLVDTRTDATDPFFPNPGDNPAVPLAINVKGKLWDFQNMTMDDIFIDYIMFKPAGGIWVPEGTFGWDVSNTATIIQGQRNWTVSGPGGHATKPAIDHTAWPRGWTGIANYYNDLRRTS